MISGPSRSSVSREQDQQKFACGNVITGGDIFLEIAILLQMVIDLHTTMQEHTHAGEQFVCQLLPGEFMKFVETRDTLASRAAVQALFTRARGARASSDIV